MGWVSGSSRGETSSLTTTKPQRWLCHPVAHPAQPFSACFAPFAFCSPRGPTVAPSEGSVLHRRRWLPVATPGTLVSEILLPKPASHAQG